MTVKTQTALQIDIDSTSIGLADNTTGDIEPSDIRDICTHLNDMLHTTLVEDGANTVLDAQVFRRTKSGADPAIGIGVGLLFEVETATGGNVHPAGSIDFVSTNVSAGAENFDLVIGLSTVAGALAEALRITDVGQLLGVEGSNSLPTYSFKNNATTGMTSAGSGAINFISSGNSRFQIWSGGAIVQAGIFRVPLGTEAAPTYVFNSNTTTGIWSSGTGIINFSLVGSEVFEIDATSMDVTVPIRGPNGSALLPGLSFGSDPDSGMYTTGNTLRFATSAVQRMFVTSSGLHIQNAHGLIVGHSAQEVVAGIVNELQILGTGAADSSIAVARYSNDANAASLYGAKSRATAILGHTIVSDNDAIFDIEGLASDGTDFAESVGRIRFEVDDGSPAANAIGGSQVFSTSTTAGALVEAFRISSSQHLVLPNGFVTLIKQAEQTSNFTAVAGNWYPIDTSAGAFTMTFPSSPSVGDEVGIMDANGTFNTNNLTLGRNGQNVLRVAADGTIDTDNWTTSWVFLDATNGWIPKGF